MMTARKQHSLSSAQMHASSLHSLMLCQVSTIDELRHSDHVIADTRAYDNQPRDG